MIREGVVSILFMLLAAKRAYRNIACAILDILLLLPPTYGIDLQLMTHALKDSFAQLHI